MTTYKRTGPEDDVLHADGSVTQMRPPAGSRKYTLAQIQKAVGGTFTTARTQVKRMILLVNEEGLLLGLPRNDAASQLAGQDIVGDVIVTTPDRL
jgi:hypothetical protein